MGLPALIAPAFLGYHENETAQLGIFSARRTLSTESIVMASSPGWTIWRQHHPNHPQVRGNYAPINFEASYDDLVVEGKVPEGCRARSIALARIQSLLRALTIGSLVRAVHAFHIDNGRVDYLNRWVRTLNLKNDPGAWAGS